MDRPSSQNTPSGNLQETLDFDLPFLILASKIFLFVLQKCSRFMTTIWNCIDEVLPFGLQVSGLGQSTAWE